MDETVLEKQEIELMAGFEAFAWSDIWKNRCPNCAGYLDPDDDEARYNCLSNCGFKIGFSDFEKMRTIVKKPWRK